MRRAIRKYGLPGEIRLKVWLLLMERKIGNKYDASNLLKLATETIEYGKRIGKVQNDDAISRLTPDHLLGQLDAGQLDDLDRFRTDIEPILKQIELDVDRTMPGDEKFDDTKLRRILVAYSVHINRDIGYCQGFNFIVALLLDVFEGNEEHSLKGFVCIVDHMFPSKFYFDHYLTGARADQFLLADFICDQLVPSSSQLERKTIEDITSSITLNWFISLFHNAVPNLTRLIIMDNFMVDGVKALFRFSIGLLKLAFQITSPSSCEVFNTIRCVSSQMNDIKLLLSIVDRIKLPKDSYFAIKRSFYMVQSSFNSDLSYVEKLVYSNINSNTSTSSPSNSLISNFRPKFSSLSHRRFTMASSIDLPDRRSFKSKINSGFASEANGLNGNRARKSSTTSQDSTSLHNNNNKRICVCMDKSKICIQTLGKLGRSHLRILNANYKSNEKSLLSPLRNCYVIGLENCGKVIILARQASSSSTRRNCPRIYRHQDLIFNVYEYKNEIFDGFYRQDLGLVVIITQLGEIIKIKDSSATTTTTSIETKTLTTSGTGNAPLEPEKMSPEAPKAQPEAPSGLSAEGLLLLGNSNQKSQSLKLRAVSLDELTNLLWICFDLYQDRPDGSHTKPETQEINFVDDKVGLSSLAIDDCKFRPNNPFVEFKYRNQDKRNNDEDDDDDDNDDDYESDAKRIQMKQSAKCKRKITIVDMISFDVFSSFELHPCFGPIISMRTCMAGFCQFSNSTNSQFGSRIVKIDPTGRFEHLLSLSDVVDFMIKTPNSLEWLASQQNTQESCHSQQPKACESAQGNTSRASGGVAQQNNCDEHYLGQHLTSSSPLTKLKLGFLDRMSLVRVTSTKNQPAGELEASNNNCATSDDSDNNSESDHRQSDNNNNGTDSSGFSSKALVRYYNKLIRNSSGSTTGNNNYTKQQDSRRSSSSLQSQARVDSIFEAAFCGRPKLAQDPCRVIMTSCFDTLTLSGSAFPMDDRQSAFTEASFLPMNMTFVFSNGKIVLFEFAQPYTIKTRESQLDRFDYFRLVDIVKHKPRNEIDTQHEKASAADDSFVLTMLTVFDKLIKVVI